MGEYAVAARRLASLVDRSDAVDVSVGGDDRGWASDSRVAARRSRNGFSRDRMPAADAAAFEAARDLIAPYAPDGVVTLRVRGELRWGHPLAEATG